MGVRGNGEEEKMKGKGERTEKWVAGPLLSIPPKKGREWVVQEREHLRGGVLVIKGQKQGMGG